jgi:hypothetical protein
MLNIFIIYIFTLYFTVSTSYVNSISSSFQHKPQLFTLKTSNKLNKLNTLTNMKISEEYLNIHQYVNSNFSQSIKETDQYIIDPLVNIKLLDMPLTDKQINISSIYLNLEKAKNIYFSKDVNNVIFTFPNDLSDLYYYDVNNNDTKGVLYRVSNNTRISMKNLKKFVFQTFNNNIDGILF